jgi:hypothetical protein
MSSPLTPIDAPCQLESALDGSAYLADLLSPATKLMVMARITAPNR